MENELPKLSLEAPETDCCPQFEPEPWDGKEFRFENKLFAMGKTVNFMHVPLNFGGMMKKSWTAIEAAEAKADSFLLLSSDPSPWRGEHLFAVSKEVPGMETVRLTGNFLTKVYQGPYKDAGKWVREMTGYVEGKGRELKRLHFFYTTCPKCADYYGKNYTVAFAEVE